MDGTDTLNSTEEMKGVYSDKLKLLLDKAKKEAFSYNNFSSHFSNDLRHKAKELWAEAHQQLSESIDESVKNFLEFTRTEKKFLELEELKRKYPSSLGEAWSFSGVPENDWMDISDSTASDFIPEYEEQLLQSQAIKGDLVNKYQLKMDQLKDLKREIETMLDDMVVTTYNNHTNSC